MSRSLFITISTVICPVILQLYYIRYVSYYVDKVVFADFVLLSSFVYALSQIFLSIPGQAFSRFYNAAKDKILFVNEFRTYLFFVNLVSVFFVVSIWYFYESRFDIESYLFIYLLFVLLNNYSLNQQVFLLNLDRKVFFILKLLEACSKFTLPLIIYSFYGSFDSFLIGIIIGYGLSSVCLAFFLKDIPFQFYINLKNQKKYLYNINSVILKKLLLIFMILQLTIYSLQRGYIV